MTTPVTATSADDEFQKELLELFAQEAQEWLGQVSAALDELEHRPPADRHAKFIEVIARGLTNLGGSAATVNLPAIEQATFALLPLLEHFRNPDAVIQPESFISFRRNLDEIAAAILPYAPASSAESAVDSLAENHAACQSATFLKALKDLQAARARASEPSRNLAEVVIRKLERDLQEGLDRLDVSSLQTMLRELHGMDEQFLETLRRHMPAITQVVARLKQAIAAGAPPTPELHETIRQVQALRDAARTANAAPLMRFLTGLQSFLTVVAQRRIVLAAKKIEAVESRLHAVVSMAQQWVEVGQDERAAIGKLLPT